MPNQDKNELINQIYDTIMNNAEISEFHTKFPVDDVEYQFVKNTDDTIHFRYKDIDYVLVLQEEWAGVGS